MDESNNFYQKLFLGFLGVFLLFNLVTMSSYGMTWDEAAQQHVGRATWDYVSSKTKTLEFQRDDLIYYGPFFEVVNYGFGNFVLNSFKISYVDAFHLLILLTAVLGLWFLYKLVSLIFNPRVGLFAGTFMMLLPRFVAHAHYNSKDIPLLAGFIIVLYFLYKGFNQRQLKSVLFAGAAWGLTLAIRVDALVILPVFFSAYLVYLFFEDRSWPRLKKDIFLFFAFISVSALSLFLVWPSLWHHPMLFFQSVSYFMHHGWQGEVLYLGHVYKAASLPLSYAPLYILITIPVALLALALGGLVMLARKVYSRQYIFPAALIVSWIAVRLILAFLPNAVRYDGVRHFLVLFPAIMILSALGFDWFLDKISQIKQIDFRPWVIAGLVLWLLVEFFSVFPFGDSYFNEPARIVFGAHLERKFEIEYWGATVREGTEWLNLEADKGNSFCLPLAEHLLQFYPIRSDLKFDCDKPDYLMFFTRYTFLPGKMDEKFHYSNLTPVFTISRLNSDLLYIYKLDWGISK